MKRLQDLGIAVIGLGVRAYLIELIHRPGRGARVVALCDRDAAVLTQRCAALGGPDKVFTSRDYLEVVQNPGVDAVVVLSPDHLHEEMAVAALQAGKTVFCDKPLSISTSGCDRILSAAAQSGSRLYVGHNMRHFPVVRLLKRLIDDGAIGEPRAIWCRHFVGHGGDYYFKDWHAQRRHTHSLLLQKGAHDIDVIHWLVGGVGRLVQGLGGLVLYDEVRDRHSGQKASDWLDPERHWPPLSQKQLHPEIDVEDLSMLQMRLDNGVFASYQQCHFTPDYWRNYTIIGTSGRLENFGDINGVVRLWNRRHDYCEHGDREYAFSAQQGGHGGADVQLIDEFLRFARAGGPTDTSPVAAREAVAVGCAATDSLRHGGMPVAVSPPPEAVSRYFARHT